MRIKENYIALARVVCALAVVMIHTNTCFIEFNMDKCWPLANVIDCGLGFAVPVFIMISGATLIDYRERYTTKEYFKKRVIKVFIPFLIWGMVAILYVKAMNTIGIFFVYLFFVDLFIVYLSIPFFSLIKGAYGETVFIILIPILFCVNFLFPNLNNYIFYALIGYLLDKKELTFRKRLFIYILAIVGFIIHICGTYVLSINVGEIVHTFRGYTNLPCCLMAIGVFVFIKKIGKSMRNKKIIDFINELSEYTFPVYILHLYVIDLFTKPIWGNTHSVLYRIGTPFITFSICIGLTWIIRRIPIVKRCLP